MMRLYHREHAGRPIRVAWVLEELGEPYEITVMTREESNGEEHRVRHPLGRVPVLEDDDGFVFESAAICLHLADLHPNAGLAPAPGTHERALTRCGGLPVGARQCSCLGRVSQRTSGYRPGVLRRGGAGLSVRRAASFS
jgi:glutathione S-transferase